ncbi:MAG: glycosyltransferase [Candidatus Omnitrophota bacterium]
MDYEKFNDKQIIDILSKFGDPSKIRILYISTYIPNYIRTQAILNILQRNKINVETVFSGNKRFKYLSALFYTICRLRRCDIIFLGFRSHEVFPFFKLLTRKPIIFDAFVSAYDTLCLDRRVFKPGSIIGKFLKAYDTYLCRQASVVLVDTKAHSEYFKNEFRADNVSYLYLECNTNLFKPVKREARQGKFIVFWYGKCWPLQGVDVIIKAAGILKNEAGIIFRLIGPLVNKNRNLVRQLNPTNIEFIDYVAYENLPLEIAKADLCLGGHFSGLPKAKRVIPGKAFQCIACRKATILGDNPANRELFEGRKDIYFVQMNSAKALADKILEVKNARN